MALECSLWLLFVTVRKVRFRLYTMTKSTGRFQDNWTTAQRSSSYVVRTQYLSVVKMSQKFTSQFFTNLHVHYSTTDQKSY